MKLQEFFDTQKHTSFTDVDKLDLYQSILYKKSKRNSLRRSSFVHAKYLVYTMVFVVLVLGTYGVYFMNTGNIQDNNRFAIRSNTTNTAQADYIAQVVNFNGNFSIEHNGVLATTKNIGNGDTIILKKDAELMFEINSGTQSKIIGPAKLVIQKIDTENYKLNLIYGNFIQMEWKKTKNQTIELAINDITVKQEDKSQPLNFKFIKNEKNQIFQNNGANIIVTRDNKKDETTTISKEQVVAIQNNDIKVFANISNFTKAVQEKNISQTFSLVSETANTGTRDKEETMLLSLLDAPQITENKDEITKNITSTLGNEKQILDPSQDEKINASLYSEFYAPELKDIENAFIGGNEALFNVAFDKIEKRVQSVYQGFDMTYNKQSGSPIQKLGGLQTAIKTLKEKINNNYDVPPKYLENLQSIGKTLANIISKWYGSTPANDAATTKGTSQE